MLGCWWCDGNEMRRRENFHLDSKDSIKEMRNSNWSINKMWRRRKVDQKVLVGCLSGPSFSSYFFWVILLCFFVLILPLMVVRSSPAPAPEFDWTSIDIDRTESTISAESSTTAVTSTAKPGRHQLLSCPRDCVCKNSETVDCRGSGIRNVTNFLANQHVTKL